MQNKILLAGLHDTGKTTFIAALWYMLNKYNESDRVTISSFKNGEYDYLNKIRDHWMKYEPVPRTAKYKSQGESVIINIKDNVTQKNFILNIPDFSGETFNDHFEFREWSEDYQNSVEDLSGILLFINPNQTTNTPRLLIEENQLLEIFGSDKLENDKSKFIDYDTNHTSNQVKLVEVLQFLQVHTKLKAPLKVSLIVSMWDTILLGAPNTKPVKWLEKNAPLLSQFLLSNSEIFSVKVFGVSSQGDSYDNRDALADVEPLKRVKICDEDGSSNDITKTIFWILE